MFQSPGSVEARIVALLADVQREVERGHQGEAVVAQRKAADQARKLAAMLPGDVRVRQGLASILYNLASMLVSTGDMAAAVPELDDCLNLYESLAGAVADAGLLCADYAPGVHLPWPALGVPRRPSLTPTRPWWRTSKQPKGTRITRCNATWPGCCP